MQLDDIKRTIRVVPDFPKPGINFYDVVPLFRDARVFRSTVEHLVAPFKGQPLDALVGIDARGFVLASAMAYELGLGLVLVRKFGKLPGETESEEYQLEYGKEHIEIQREALGPGQSVVIVDDLLATGGTAAAAARLIERVGARLEGYAFMVELGLLEGREKLRSTPIFSLIHYD